uniref:Uncharacterized protein n=1 Tax=Piura virus TaxID=1170425 RepID=A0A1S5UPD9_9VIRU|nr:hypothetical protein 3 [Piura virus]AQM55330.1 hypothetical protein 3 [Piura virus]AQM55333.1 hypothetical protein 3 [Piura virus]AQM55336.1 hypothetical protein 3 [Piura virus]AQM55339.1 hypothetical protein 3 [Piura virus]
MNSTRKTSKTSARSPGAVVSAARNTTPKRAVVRPAPKRTQDSSFDLNKIVSDVSSTFFSALNRPLVLLSLVMVVAFVFTHQSDFSSGAVGKYVAERAETNSLAKWVHENQFKFLGLAIFAPAVLNSPEKMRVVLGLATLLWVMLVPQASVLEYVLQALALHSYFRVRLQQSRLFIMVVVVFLYFMGYLTLVKSPDQQVPSGNGTV